MNEAKTVSGTPSKHMKSLKDYEVFAHKADCAQLLSTSGSDNNDQESWKNFGAKQHEESGASVGKYMEYSQLLAIFQWSLGLVQTPLTSMPLDTDMLVKMYNLPMFDDPLVFDKYFLGALTDLQMLP